MFSIILIQETWNIPVNLNTDIYLSINLSYSIQEN